MALITRAAIQNPDFLEIDGARNYKLPPTKRNPEGGYVANHHRMLVKNTSVLLSWCLLPEKPAIPPLPAIPLLPVQKKMT